MRADASLEIGSAAPQFDALLGADGEQYSLSSFDGVPVLVVMFLSNGCPTVAGYKDRLRGIAQEYGNRGIQLVAINSNSPYVSPRDAYSGMVDRGRDFGLDFPYLKDKDGKMARDYGAVCTPHVFVFNEARLLCYTAGSTTRASRQRDESRPEERSGGPACGKAGQRGPDETVWIRDRVVS